MWPIKVFEDYIRVYKSFKYPRIVCEVSNSSLKMNKGLKFTIKIYIVLDSSQMTSKSPGVLLMLINRIL